MSFNLKRFLPWHGKRKPPKIVALLPARNEGAKLTISLKALACHTDAIIYLDDCSTDDSLHYVETCREECRVERILTKNYWKRDEPHDRNRLLQAGRDIGGTHFIVIDADEALTSNFLTNSHLRKLIFGLYPGDAISLPWIHLWRSMQFYRLDGIMGVHHYKKCIFCDDGKSTYKSDFIHTPRVPKMKGKSIRQGLPYGLMHFQCANWDNVTLKQKWYAWLEHVEKPERSIEDIIARYKKQLDENGLKTETCPAEWLEHYPFFDPALFTKPDQWRLKQMEEWEKAKGSEYFSRLF